MNPLTAYGDPLTLSPYLADLARRYPDTHALALEGNSEAEVRRLIGHLSTIPKNMTEAEAVKALRVTKAQISLLLGHAEMSGSLTTRTTAWYLSDFADACLAFTLAHLLTEMTNRGLIAPASGTALLQDDRGNTQVTDFVAHYGFFILALGKHGGQELNYSSDIDPIFFYDPDRVTATGRKSVAELFQRLARTLIDMMERRTSDGYVFRVDLRLRPDPSATPLAVSVRAAEHYYQAHAQNWERAAFIKARFAAGDKAAADNFLDQIRPWLWRKTIDFTALDDLTRLKALVEDRAEKAAEVNSVNVKIGAGGIREIEFYAQIHQLLYGGKHPDLRIRRTDTALERLTDLGFITEDRAVFLTTAYYFLRRVEHACQVLLDHQTHSLPTAPEKLIKVSHLVGYKDPANLSEQIALLMGGVRRIYATLLADKSDGRGGDSLQSAVSTSDTPHLLGDGGLKPLLAKAGFNDPDAVVKSLEYWHSGKVRAVSSERARHYLDRNLHRLLAAFKDAPDPDTAFRKLDGFVQALPSGAQLFALFDANPKLLSLLVRVMTFAPALADHLVRTPMLFAAILEPGFFDALDVDGALDTQLDSYFMDAVCQETALDCARRAHADMIFRAGIHLLEKLAPPETVAKYLSDCADSLVKRLAYRVTASFEERHGILQDSQLDILALGRWGGQFLTFSSDLDLVYVYTQPKGDSVQTFSNGEKPLTAPVYFTRLAQRLSSAFSAPTSAGPLFDIDTRLRPSGAQGPLAVSRSAFDTYFADQAWTWERLALTRARLIGLAPAMRPFWVETVKKALMPPKPMESIRADAAEMRQKLRDQFDKSQFWDVKHCHGGLVDIEFIVQTLVLGAVAADKWDVDTAGASDLLMMIEVLEGVGLLPPDEAHILRKGYHLQSDLLMLLRLSVGENMPDVNTVPLGIANFLADAMGVSNLGQIQASLTDLRCRIQAVTDRVFDT